MTFNSEIVTPVTTYLILDNFLKYIPIRKLVIILSPFDKKAAVFDPFCF